MRRALKIAGTGLLFLLAALAFAAALVPKLLDQHYYDGPVSDHYDGERFFNPGAPAQSRSPWLMARFFTGAGKAVWPDRVAVKQGVAPAQATPCLSHGGTMNEGGGCVLQVDPRLMVATWIGHATVLVQAGGVTVLTDPMFSERASPISWLGPRRVRAPGIRLQDLPPIDIIVISHNHYDHLDLPSLKALWQRDEPMIVTSLGNDTILHRAGIGRPAGAGSGRAVARDWGQTVGLHDRACEPRCTRKPFATVTVEPNHHWGSRYGSDRNRALWSSFRINTPAGAIYHAGDTGLGDGRWAAEAAARGPIRLAILPIGAYEPREAMKENHVNPPEAVRVFDALRPAMALGIHWGTFQLTFEPIDAPRQWLARIRGERRFVTTEVGRSVVVPER